MTQPTTRRLATEAYVLSKLLAKLGTDDAPELIRDTIGSTLVAGSNVTISVNDATNTITISSTGGTGGSTDVEIVRDTIAAALTAGGYISITPNDAGDTIAVSTTAALQTALDGKAARTLTKRTITASYTLAASDATNIVLHSTASSAVTITLPLDSAVSIPQETPIPWRQYSSGQLIFAGATGVTLNSRGGVFKSAGQFAEGIVTKVGSNAWVLSGDIVA